MKYLKLTAAALVAALVISGVVLGGWQAGWWFTQHNVNRQAHVIRNGYSNQQTLREEITRKIGDYQTIQAQIQQAQGDPAFSGLKPQGHAILAIVCQDAEQVTGDQLPQDQAQFITDNCLYGSPRN